MKTKKLSVLAAILALTMALTACGTQPILEARSQVAGTLLLSVNPEIEIEYDRNGIVLELEGRNDDGKELLLHYTNYEGKTVQQVTSELVEAIYASGKFDLQLDGNDKNIVVKLEDNSLYPSDAFLEEIAQGIRAVVSQQNKQSEPVVVDKPDLNENGLIGLDKAQELVLTQLDLPEATFTQKEYDLEDGKYELEFTANGVEYEYDVDAITGKILEAEAEPADQPILPALTAITLEEAKAIVFGQLGITEADTHGRDFELDDGIYELDFQVGNMEYEYEVDAATGKILKAEKELDD